MSRPIDVRARTYLTFLFVITSLALLAGGASGGWSTDPAVNDLVPFVEVGQCAHSPTLLPDDQGGALVFAALHACSGGTDAGLRAQRIDSDGNAMWAASGVALAPYGAAEASAPVSDGEGGAFIAFDLGTSVEVQHLLADGTTWAPGLVTVTPPGLSFDFRHPVVASDGKRGVIVAWWDTRAPAGFWAQRLSGAGTALWAAGGVPLQSVALSSAASWAGMVADGSGGALLIGLLAGTTHQLTAFGVDANGQRRIGERGVVVGHGSDQTPSMVPDGLGGALIAYIDVRIDGAGDLFADRVDPSGGGHWIDTAVCTLSGAQSHPRVTADGAGGGFIVWQDATRNGTPGDASYDVYAQRISPAGVRMWAPNGIPVATAPGDQTQPSIACEPPLAIPTVVWTDAAGDGLDIRTQQLSLAGVQAGPAEGVPISTAPEDQLDPAVVRTSAGHIVFAWADLRHSAGLCSTLGCGEIYASGLPPVLGVAGSAPVGFAIHDVWPSPARGAVTVDFALAAGGEVRLELLDLAGRRVRREALGALGAGPHAVTIDDLRGLRPGLYLVRLTQGTRVATARLLTLD